MTERRPTERPDNHPGVGNGDSRSEAQESLSRLAHDGAAERRGRRASRPLPPHSTPRQVLARLLQPRRIWVTPLLFSANLMAAVAVAGGAMLEPMPHYFMGFGHARTRVWDGEYWRLLSAVFLHGHLLHLLVNMFALLIIGTFAERLLGWWRYLLLYFVSALVGQLSFQVFSSSVGVGASGAIYGLFPALLWIRFGWNPRGYFDWTPRLITFLAVILCVEYVGVLVIEHFASGFGVAISAHLGGLAAGLLLVHFFLTARGRTLVDAPRLPRRAGAALLALAIGAGVCGCVYPFWDTQWHAWRGYQTELAGGPEGFEKFYSVTLEHDGADAAQQVVRAAVAEFVEAKRYDAAVNYWSRFAASAPADAILLLVEPLVAARQKGLADETLETVLRQLKRQELQRKAQGLPADPQLLNAIAWTIALRSDAGALYEGLLLAEVAVKLTRQSEPKGFESFFLGERYDAFLSECVHTLGWIEFRMGDIEKGLAHLQEAVELREHSALYVYLAWAHYELDNLGRAEEALGKAVELGDRLGPIERAKAAELREELGLDP